MTKPLTVSEIKNYVEKAEESFWHQDCATCEIYLAYIIQLEKDSDQEGQAFLKEYKNPRDQIHSRLVCDPCSGGTIYAEYLMSK